MKFVKLFFLFAFVGLSTLSIAQSDWQVINTYDLETFQSSDIAKTLLFENFTNSNVYYGEGMRATVRQNLSTNASLSTNTFFVKTDDNILEVSNANLRNIFSLNNDLPSIIAENINGQRLLGENIINTETIVVYRFEIDGKDAYMGMKNGKLEPLTTTTDGIEAFFNIKNGGVKEAVFMRKLNLNKKSDLKTLLTYYSTHL